MKGCLSACYTTGDYLTEENITRIPRRGCYNTYTFITSFLVINDEMRAAYLVDNMEWIQSARPESENTRRSGLEVLMCSQTKDNNSSLINLEVMYLVCVFLSIVSSPN